MTSQEAWHVARRVLGVYFVIHGLLYAAGAIAMVGIVLPEGSSRVGYVTSVLLQAVIAAIAGIALLRGTVRRGDVDADVEPLGLKRSALQLLGIFFLVSGSSAFAKAAVDVLTIGAGWEFRVSQFATATVEIVCAVLLIARPNVVATALQNYDRS
jgi:hypothetical protein